MSENLKPSCAMSVLDVRDVSCPMPLLKTRQRLRMMQEGERLRVLTGDKGSLRDIPAYVRSSEHELLEVNESEAYEFLILVGAVNA